jgi:eukaryotic-like serine/threonine-protein kinase
VGDTLLQFGSTALADEAPAQRIARSCSACNQTFSSDARFCPFDGEPLVDSGAYDPAADPLIGSIVDNRYEIKHVLGEGGMGIVYGVRHVALGKHFALKALRGDLSRDSEIAERFIGEARTAATISHPGLVEITDFGTMSDGRPYFVMELLDGQPLSWFIRDGGAVAAGRTVNIVRQMAEAVGAAHFAHVVHRDLKPDNVYVVTGKDGMDRVKVLDFGLAKVMGVGKRTRDGVVFGTPHYMSPEQAAGESVDHRADIYSLGIVMYELLTGRVPFEADSFMGVLSKHIYMQPTPPSQLLRAGGSLGGLEAVVLRCLEKKPKDRYQTIEELLADLDRVAPGVALAAGAPSRPSGPAPRGSDPLGGVEFLPAQRSGRVPLAPLWPVAAGFGLVVLVALGFVAIRALRSPGPPPESKAASSLPAAASALSAPAVVPLAPASTLSAGEIASAAPAAPAPVARKSTRAAAPGAAPAVAAPAPAAETRPEPPPVRPTRKAAGIRGEIVDPWGQ